MVITERDVRRMGTGEYALAGKERRESDHHRQRERDQAGQDRLRGQDQAALRRRREGRADQAAAVLVRGDERAEHAEQENAEHHEVEVDDERIEPGLLHRVEVRPVRPVVAGLPVRQPDERDRAEQRRQEHGAQRPQLDPFGGQRGPRPAVRGGRGVSRRSPHPGRPSCRTLRVPPQDERERGDRGHRDVGGEDTESRPGPERVRAAVQQMEGLLAGDARQVFAQLRSELALNEDEQRSAGRPGARRARPGRRACAAPGRR